MDKFFSDLFCNMGGCSNCEQFSTCEYLKFAFTTMVFGFLCVTADWLIYKLTTTSYLKLKYIKGTLLVIVFWTLGSLIVGYIGAATQIFNTTKILSALTVGTTWQIIFARWAAGKFEKEDKQPLNAN